LRDSRGDAGENDGSDRNNNSAVIQHKMGPYTQLVPAAFCM